MGASLYDGMQTKNTVVDERMRRESGAMNVRKLDRPRSLSLLLHGHAACVR